MKSASFFAMAGLFVATAAMTFTASGCSKPKEDDKKSTVVSSPAATTSPSPSPSAKQKEPIKAGTGTIKGKFVYDVPPVMKPIPELLNHKDCAACKLADDKEYMKGYQKWIVGKDKGVPNVVVRLKAPEDKYYFEASESDLKVRKAEKVTLDQPCCAFEPHVAVLYPEYFDGKKFKTTGQALLVKNSATFLHNTKIVGDEKKGNAKPSKSLEANTGSAEFVLVSQDAVIDVNCDAHTWMNAKLFAFDNPYAAVTGMDGTFEIKNVPNQKLIVEFWHEEKGWFDPTDVNVAAGETKTLDKTISAK